MWNTAASELLLLDILVFYTQLLISILRSTFYKTADILSSWLESSTSD